MSAPLTELPSSVSSSGHADGLGRRVLAFDRETGAMLERLHVRPELAAFEAALRDRVALLATLNDERFAHPVAVDHDHDSGDLMVVSGFVPGSRLAELIDAAREHGTVPGVDAALGYLLAARTAGLLAAVGLDLPPDTQVERLSPGERQLVEVAKALQLDARIIIFDEPTTSLTPQASRLLQMPAARRGIPKWNLGGLSGGDPSRIGCVL